jgi:hypothetical protein
MVTQTIQFEAPSLRQIGSGTIIAELFQGSTSKGTLSAISEDGTRPGRFTGTVADKPAGEYDLQVRFNAFTISEPGYSVALLLTVGTYVAAMPSAGGGLTPEEADTLNGIAAALGGAPVEPTGATVFEHLEAIQAATDTIGTRPMEFVGNVADGGQLLLTVGDDHETVIGNDLPIRVADPGQTLFTKLTAGGASLQWSAGQGVTPNMITGTVTTPTHSNGITTIIVQVPNTPSPASGNIFAPFKWQLQRTISGRRQRMLKGTLKLDPDMIGS